MLATLEEEAWNRRCTYVLAPDLQQSAPFQTWGWNSPGRARRQKNNCFHHLTSLVSWEDGWGGTEVGLLWTARWDLFGVTHWMCHYPSKKMSIFVVLLFAIFLVLVLGQEAWSRHCDVLPLLSLVSPLKEEGNFVQVAHSLKCDWTCLNCFSGCLPSWDWKDWGSAGKEQLNLMGLMRATYRPLGPWIDFKGNREGSSKRFEQQACHNLLKQNIL